MKRFRSFLLFSAVAALLAFAGSAWAADLLAKTSPDVVSLDLAVEAALKFEGHGKESADLYTKLSVDAYASFDKAITSISVVSSPDKEALGTISKDEKVAVFLVGSTDIKPVEFKALKISPDNPTSSVDLQVAFPVALFELGKSGDVRYTSDDKKISAVQFVPYISEDHMMTINDIFVSTDVSSLDLKLVVESTDGFIAYKPTTAKPKSSDVIYVVQKAGTSLDLPVSFKFSDDISGDLLVTKWVYTDSSDKKSAAYGLVSDDKALAWAPITGTSRDVLKLSPMAYRSEKSGDTKVKAGAFDDVVVTIYDVSQDRYSYGVQLKRYAIKDGAKVHFEVGGASWDKVVSFDTPSSWVVKAPVSADLEKVSGDLGDNYAKVLSGDTVKVTWYTSSDFTGTSYDFSEIVTSDLKLYGSFDAEAETSTGKTITVKISADKTSIAVGETATFKITTVSPDLTGAKYTWFKGNASTDKTSSADFVVSSDKAGSFDVYVLVTSGDYTGSSDKVSVTVTEAASTTVTLSSLDVTVSPDDSEPWDVSADKADSIPLTLTVVGTFSDSSSKDVTSSTTNTWTLGSSVDTKIFSLSSTSGATTTIAIASTITSGEYSVPVTAKAVSGDVSKDVTVTYIIVASGSSATPGSDAADAAKDEAQKAVADAIKGITNPSIEDVLKSAEAVAAIGKTVSSTGELDMSVLDGVTSLKGLATLLSNLKAAGTTVSTLDFASMGTSLTSIGAGDLQGVSVTAMTFTNNKNITSVNFSGATVSTVTLTSSAVKTLSLPSDANVATVNAQGASDLTTVEVAGNTNIKELDIGETSVASLDVKGCTSLTTLAVDNTNASGQGSLEELDITSCDSLTRLDVQRNKLLGIKKPSPSFAKPEFVFNAGGQRRAAPSGFTLSTSMNFWSILRSLLGLGNSGTIPFTVTTTTVTFNYGGTLNNETGEVTYTTTPTAFSYSYNPGFTTAGSSSVSTAADSTMDVQIGDSGDSSTTTEAKLGSSSGGGCDAGFGFGALAALMAVFALKKRR